MKSFRNLIILGTSHIAIESINDVKALIEKEKPDILALELDLLRFKKLMSNKKQKFSIRSLSSSGSLMSIIGAFIEKKLGEKVGVKPGDEMKAAINLAKKNKIKIVLIDQPIQITFKRLSEEITLKEKLTFLSDILTSLIFPKKRIKIDLTKVPEEGTIAGMINEVKKRYPNVYKTLIYERNIYMAKQLIELVKIGKKTIVIVGAGHESDLLRMIKWNLEKKNYTA